MSRAQREKGKRGERQAAREIERVLGIPASRTAQHCGKAGMADIDMGAAFHPEVKTRKSIAACRFFDQAESDRGENALPIVLMKEDRGPFFLMLKLDDLPQLMELIADAKQSEVTDSDPGSAVDRADSRNRWRDGIHRKA